MRTVERQAALLEALAKSPHEGTPLRTLANEVGLAPSSTHRLLRGLVDAGLAAQDPARQGYRLGRTVLRLAGAYLEQVGFADVMLPYLEEVTSATGTVSFTSVRDGDTVICTSVRAPRETTSFYVRIGKVLPWHASAAAKALIHGMDADRLRRNLGEYIGQRHTQHTLTSVDAVLEDLRAGKARGYWECVEELEPDVYAVSAPVATRDGRPVASITAVCHRSQRAAELGSVAERVVAAARRASDEVAALLHAGQIMEAAR
ncbi:MAG TPA: IclR family transcriptional regulator [Trueperaceae bacterium]|nr:IclR family transcriptional regulator [Trueperaceae bacterium]